VQDAQESCHKEAVDSALKVEMPFQPEKLTERPAMKEHLNLLRFGPNGMWFNRGLELIQPPIQ
jgi:hypothetical protein